MPWHIEQRNSRYCVIKDSDNSVEKCHATRREAVAHMAALYASESGKMISFGMPIQIKDFKGDGDDWIVEGYASIFGNVDLGGDVVLPGAFDRTLDDGHKVKFFHSHDPRMVLGVPLKLAPDKKGLYTRNKISKTKLGEETRQLLMDGAMDSFSIGYRATDVDYAEGGEVRQLKDVDLFEISLVALPMNQEAVVTRVKDYYHLLGIAEQGSSDEAGEENRTTLVERSRFLQEDFRSFSEDVRALVAQIDRPLSKTKRQELNELLELCSRLDAVRSDLSSVLAATPESLAHLPVTSRRLRYDLAESRKRLARIYEE